MKKINVITCILISLNAFSQNIELPYYGKIKCATVCGQSDCQPTNSKYYSKVNKDYSNNYGELGRKFYMFNDLGEFLMRRPTDKDIRIINQNSFTAKVQTKDKNNFVASAKADLVTLFGRLTELLPDDKVKADFEASLQASIEKEALKDMEIEYKVIELHQDYLDELRSHYKDLKKDEVVAVAISVITLKGTWSQNIIKANLTTLEAKFKAFSAVSAEAKAEFEKAKLTILQGNFASLSKIVYVAYKYSS